MNIRVVIPLAKPELLPRVHRDYREFARPTTQITVTSLEDSVPREADPTDSNVKPEIVKQIQQAEREGADAVVIDCMDDPGMETGRKLVSIPVIGPGQASYHLAAILGHTFSVLYPLEDTTPVENLVDHYGLTQKLASVRWFDCSLDKIEKDKQSAFGPLIEASVIALKQDGAHVIVPACTATIGLALQIQRCLEEMGYTIPVIEPASVAIRLAESLVEMGLTSSRNSYPRPMGISQSFW